MGIIRTIDQGIRSVIFALFWWLIDPLDKDRLLGQIKDTIERSIDINNPEKTISPDNFEIQVNNKVFIKHAHSNKQLEAVLADHIQRYVADNDYELFRPRITVQILSSATMSKRKADIRCWFSSEETSPAIAQAVSRLHLEVIAGEGKGLRWELTPGNTYKIGRSSTANICLPFDNISKTQATLYYLDPDKITLVDEGSANGTYIDDETERISGSRALSVGTKINLCKMDPVILTLSSG